MKNNSLLAEIDSIFEPNFNYNDAGRSKTKWSGTNDCGIRAFSLATGIDYNKSRKYLKAFTHIGYAGNRRLSTGIYNDDMILAMESFGWIYIECGKNVYARQIPNKTMLNMPRHFSYKDNGMIQDTWDCSMRPVLGYYAEVAE